MEHSNRFCLSCHPKGLADGLHPEARFPITSGSHRNMPCNDCHVPSVGTPVAGYNTSCVGCHTGQHAQSRVNGQHSGVRGYAFDPNNPHFCLRCHPSGRGD
jgi:hypothetical protein